MISQMQISKIQSYLNESKDTTEQQLLNELLDEMQYRVPRAINVPGSTCPRCNLYLKSDYSFCPHCGQMLE